MSKKSQSLSQTQNNYNDLHNVDVIAAAIRAANSTNPAHSGGRAHLGYEGHRTSPNLTHNAYNGNGTAANNSGLAQLTYDGNGPMGGRAQIGYEGLEEVPEDRQRLAYNGLNKSEVPRHKQEPP